LSPLWVQSLMQYLMQQPLVPQPLLVSKLLSNIIVHYIYHNSEYNSCPNHLWRDWQSHASFLLWMLILSSKLLNISCEVTEHLTQTKYFVNWWNCLNRKITFQMSFMIDATISFQPSQIYTFILLIKWVEPKFF